MRNLTFKYDNGDREVELPGKYALCDNCRGHGTVDHPAFSNGITASEWNDEWDDESRQTYLRGGYNVRCPACDGEKVVVVPDRMQCDPEEYRAWRKFDVERQEDEAACRAERRMESMMLGEW
jgi:hypothetical protein